VEHFRHYWSVGRSAGFDVFVSELCITPQESARRTGESISRLLGIKRIWERVPRQMRTIDSGLLRTVASLAKAAGHAPPLASAASGALLQYTLARDVPAFQNLSMPAGGTSMHPLDAHPPHSPFSTSKAPDMSYMEPTALAVPVASIASL